MLPKSKAGCLRSPSKCTRKLYIKLCVVVCKVLWMAKHTDVLPHKTDEYISQGFLKKQCISPVTADQ